MISRWIRSIAAAAAVATLGGCAGRPFDYRPGTETPPGPGMLTGERGAFVFGATAPGSDVPPAAAPAGASTAPPSMFEEFRSYQEFLRHKEARTIEYRDLLEWLQWKRYLEWQQSRERR